MSRYDDRRAQQDRIQRQAAAEFDFGLELRAHGIDADEFMEHFGLSHHCFNVLAQTLAGVNDEDIVLPRELDRALEMSECSLSRFVTRVEAMLATIRMA